jgi:DNA-binding NtrC family response regulator
MKEKILIVEDEFIEANYIRAVLERAGYLVCAIARSMDKALELIEREKPGVVLLDIFLSGKGTGIDLARLLKERHIAFVFLSANSNENVLSLAKATEPYGFLVKPFRENDLLVTLEIARFRHEHSLESKYRREALLQQQLEKITGEKADWEQKLCDTAKAFQPYIPFDLLAVTYHTLGGDRLDVGFLRVGFDEYQTLGIDAVAVITGKPKRELEQLQARDALTPVFMETFQLESSLFQPLHLMDGRMVQFAFFSRRREAYSTEHGALFSRLHSILTSGIETMFPRDLLKGGPVGGRVAVGGPATAVRDGGSGGRAMREQEPVGETMRGFEGIIGKSHQLLKVFDQLTQVAPTDTSILILGESGTGKEMIASSIHALSSRKDRRLIKVNCAAIPETLIESELFGHEKGSFTGALDRKIGKFELAQGGTIFLDEIGEMPLELQVKLLHVLQDREVERVGSKAPIKIDVRVIAATNRNLEKEVAEGRFRLDLYYRLNVVPILLPPLRERKDDIAVLANYFIGVYNRKAGKRITGISAQAVRGMMAYHWPGNIRELEHFIERCVLLTSGTTIDELPPTVSLAGGGEPRIKTIQENERDHIIAVLKKCKGKIWGPGAAAEILNLPPTTLRSKMKKLGIEKEFE